jgi:hypothetical protein
MVHKNEGLLFAKRNKIFNMIGIFHKLAQTVIFSCTVVRVFGRMRVVPTKNLCYNKCTGAYYIPGEWLRKN